MAPTHPVDVARVRDGPPRSGTAVLVDRLWPRGQRRDDAPWDEWLKAVAPSTELRRWYGHDPERFEEFARRYREELDDDEHTEALEHLRSLHRRGRLVLMTATRDVDHSAARVLADVLAPS